MKWRKKCERKLKVGRIIFSGKYSMKHTERSQNQMWWIYTIRRKKNPFFTSHILVILHTFDMWYFYSESFGFCAVFTIIFTDKTDRGNTFRNATTILHCIFLCVCVRPSVRPCVLECEYVCLNEQWACICVKCTQRSYIWMDGLLWR